MNALLTTALVLTAGAACREGKSAEVEHTARVSRVPALRARYDVASAGRSMVRVLNAIPSTKKLDLTGDDRTLFSDVKYKELTPYAELHGDVVVFRALSTEGSTLLADGRMSLTDGGHYTALVLPDAKGGALLRVICDDVPPAPALSRLRVINASPMVKDAGIAILGEAQALFRGADLAKVDGYRDVAPGTVTLDVRENANGVKPSLLKIMHLEAGKAYTIVITGAKGSLIEAFTVEDANVLVAAAAGT
jgi:hypothetical protein